MLTPDDVHEMIRIWKLQELDYEDAGEEKIHEAVLAAIAEGNCSDPKMCALIALTTYKIGFERQYAWLNQDKIHEAG